MKTSEAMERKVLQTQNKMMILCKNAWFVKRFLFFFNSGSSQRFTCVFVRQFVRLKNFGTAESSGWSLLVPPDPATEKSRIEYWSLSTA